MTTETTTTYADDDDDDDVVVATPAKKLDHLTSWDRRLYRQEISLAIIARV